MDILINSANILYVVAYFTMDMLRLRILTLTAAACLAVYFYSQPLPLLNVVAWNVFFIVLNLIHIARILFARFRKARAALTKNASQRSAIAMLEPVGKEID